MPGMSRSFKEAALIVGGVFRGLPVPENRWGSQWALPPRAADRAAAATTLSRGREPFDLISVSAPEEA